MSAHPAGVTTMMLAGTHRSPPQSSYVNNVFTYKSKLQEAIGRLRNRAIERLDRAAHLPAACGKADGIHLTACQPLRGLTRQDTHVTANQPRRSISQGPIFQADLTRPTLQGLPFMEVFTAAGLSALLSGHCDRPRARRRQRHRDRPRGGWSARRPAQASNPDRHHRRHRAAHRLCPGDDVRCCRSGRSCSWRRHSASLGLLEDVARDPRQPRAGAGGDTRRLAEYRLSTRTAPSATARLARRSCRRRGRSSSPMCRCRSTTCWPWPAPR